VVENKYISAYKTNTMSYCDLRWQLQSLLSLVQLLETLDKGELFRYAPMQDEATLKRWRITPQDCEQE
jgi:predicted DCC family thiol-disulfide oxidoreductase YuxK